jgi:hypothetical protein
MMDKPRFFGEYGDLVVFKRKRNDERAAVAGKDEVCDCCGFIFEETEGCYRNIDSGKIVACKRCLGGKEDE